MVQSSRSFNSIRHSTSGSTLLVVLGVLIVAAMVAGVIWFSTRGSTTADLDTLLVEKAKKGRFIRHVIDQGDVESAKNMDIKSEIKSKATGGGGGMTILRIVPEGTMVKKGDFVAQLDAAGLENELRQQEIKLSTAKAAVEQSKIGVSVAETTLEEYEQGTFKQEEKTVINELLMAEEDLSRAKNTLIFSKTLQAKGFNDELQLAADKFAVTKAESALEIAKNKLDVLRRLTRAKMVEQFQAEIEKAKSKLVSDEISLRIEDINYKEIEEQIKKCLMVSPGDGQLVYANINAGRGGGGDFVVEEGATVRYGQAIARLPDNTNMQVKAKVAESFVTFLRPGMKAKITLDAFDGEPLSGEVIRVNDFPEPGQWFSGAVKEYATLIKIDNPPPRLRSGLTSEVAITVEDLPSEIQIPVQSVYEHKNVPFCLVRKGDKFETRQLELGSNNDKTVVVKKGIDEDEVVLLDPSTHLNLFNFPEIKTPEPPPGPPVIAAASPENKPTGASEAQKGGPRKEELASGPIPGPGGGSPANIGAGGPGAGAPTAGGPVVAAPGGGPGRGGRGGGNGPRMSPEERFKGLDANGDGNVTDDEVQASTTLPEQFKSFVMQGDVDGDGKMTLDEYKASMEKMRAMRGQGGPGGGPPGGGGFGGPPGASP
jgi:HlyD family secretion protein